MNGDMDSIENDIVRLQEERKKKEQEGATSLTSVTFDSDLYGSGNRFEGYEQSIAVTEEDEEQNFGEHEIARKLASYTAPKSIIKELPKGADDDDFGFKKSQKIIDREDDYRKRRLNRIISPDRNDAFAMGDKTPDVSMRTYADVMKEEYLKRQKEETLREIAMKKKEEEEKKASEREVEAGSAPAQTTSKRRNRWDQSQEQESNKKVKTTSGGSDWDVPDSTPGIGRWDATPTPGRVAADATPSVSRRNRWDETPTPGRLADADATPAGGGATPGATPAGMAWDATPKLAGLSTPTPKRQRSRWDETPLSMGSATPLPGATPIP